MTFYSVNSPTPLDNRFNNDIAFFDFIFKIIITILCFVIFLVLVKV